MSNPSAYTQVKQRYFKTLEQYIPIVARVHGANHPEIHAVRTLFDTMAEKQREAGTQIPELHAEFAKMREITQNYTVGPDVCETYEAVYRRLAELDAAYGA